MHVLLRLLEFLSLLPMINPVCKQELHEVCNKLIIRIYNCIGIALQCKHYVYLYMYT